MRRRAHRSIVAMVAVLVTVLYLILYVSMLSLPRVLSPNNVNEEKTPSMTESPYFEVGYYPEDNLHIIYTD